MGPFEPHRLHLYEMEYTAVPRIMKRLADRRQAIPEPAKAAKELVASGTATGTGAGEVTDQGVL